MKEVDLELPRTFANLESADFLDILCSELEENAGALPLESMCEEGGWPDEDSLEINSISCVRSATEVRIKVHVVFNEIVSTGCADISMDNAVVAPAEIILDLVESVARFA